MIQITLNFHSIGDAVKALREIPESSFSATPTASVTAAEVIAERDQNGGTLAEAKAAAQAKKSTAAKPAAASTPTTAEPAAAPEPKAEPSAPAAVEYPVLQKAVFALAGKSREAAKAVVRSFGVETFKELDPSKWGDALAAVNAALAEAV